MAKFILPRSGQAPLTFAGELVAESDGHWVNGRDQNRWHDLAVYQTASGKWVAAVAYRTRWQGETDHHTAVVCDSPAAVAKTLTDYDPAAVVQGYPDGNAYADRQAKLCTDIRRRYAAQVSEILAALPDAAEEVP